MGNLVSDRIGIDSDPELVRRQILQDRERQFAAISNPQQQLAARLGGLLGGGLVNVAQDRGFFEVNDPLLNRVSKIQGIYNDVASRVDPASNPEAFFKELSSAYTNAGLGREALKAAQEAQKAKVTGMETQLKEIQLLEKDVENIPAKIQAAQESGNMAEAQRLSGIYNRIMEGRELDKTKTKAEINRINAQTQELRDRIESGKFDWKIVNNAAGAPVGVQIIDKKTGKIRFEEVDPDVTKKFLDIAGGGAPKGGETKADKSDGSKFFIGNEAPATTQTGTGGTGTRATSGGAIPRVEDVPMVRDRLAAEAALRERDLILQRMNPTIPISTLPEEAKAQMYLNLLAMQGR